MKKLSINRPRQKGRMFQYLAHLKAFFVEVCNDGEALVYVSVPYNQARSFIQQGMPDSLMSVSRCGVLGVHGWLPYDRNISNYFTFEKDPTLSNHKSRRRLGGPFALDLPLSSHMFVVSPDARLLFTGGHWDNSLRVYNIGKAKYTAYVLQHKDVVTCVALDICGTHLISGSRDTTCMIWKVIQQSGNSQGLVGQPLQILYGHDAEVTAVSISTELDMAVSASKDGTCIISTVRKGHYLHTLRPPVYNLSTTPTISHLIVNEDGKIIIHVTDQHHHSLHIYSVNGVHLRQSVLGHGASSMSVYQDHLITGNTLGQLRFYDLFTLQQVKVMNLHVPITSIFLTKHNTHVLVGLGDGKLIVVAPCTGNPEAR